MPSTYDRENFIKDAKYEGRTYKVSTGNLKLNTPGGLESMSMSTHQRTANKDLNCLWDAVICVLGKAACKVLINSSIDKVYAKFVDNNKRCCTKKDVGDSSGIEYMTLSKYMAEGNGVTSYNGNTEESRVVDLGQLIKNAPVFFRNNYGESKDDYEGNPTLHFETFKRSMKDDLKKEVLSTNQTEGETKINHDCKMNPKVLTEVDAIVSQNLELVIKSAQRVNDNYKWFNADDLQQQNLERFIICLNNDHNIKDIHKKLEEKINNLDIYNRAYRSVPTDIVTANYLTIDSIRDKMLEFLVGKSASLELKNDALTWIDTENENDIKIILNDVADIMAGDLKSQNIGEEANNYFTILINILKSDVVPVAEKQEIILAMVKAPNLFAEVKANSKAVMDDKESNKDPNKWVLAVGKKLAQGYELEKSANNLSITRVPSRDVVSGCKHVELITAVKTATDSLTNATGFGEDSLAARLLEGPIDKKEAVKYKKLTENFDEKGNGSVISSPKASKKELSLDDGNQKNTLSNIEMVKKQNTEAVARKVEEAIKVTEKPHNGNDPKERLTKPVDGMNFASSKSKFPSIEKQEKNDIAGGECSQTIIHKLAVIKELFTLAEKNNFIMSTNQAAVGAGVMLCNLTKAILSIMSLGVSDQLDQKDREHKIVEYIKTNKLIFHEIINCKDNTKNIESEDQQGRNMMNKGHAGKQECERLENIKEIYKLEQDKISQISTKVTSVRQQVDEFVDNFKKMQGDVKDLLVVTESIQNIVTKQSEKTKIMVQRLDEKIKEHSNVDELIGDGQSRIDEADKQKKINDNRLHALTKSGLDLIGEYEGSGNNIMGSLPTDCKKSHRETEEKKVVYELLHPLKTSKSGPVRNGIARFEKIAAM